MKTFISQQAKVSRTLQARQEKEGKRQTVSIEHFLQLYKDKPRQHIVSPPLQLKDSQFITRPVSLDDYHGTINVTYGNHQCDISGHTASGCANAVWIETAGEMKNNEDSSPGTPPRLTDFNDQTYFSAGGGLVKDKNRQQTATKMHAINHRFDAGPTQGTADNIFMGTAKSNNPNHLHKVETPLLNSLSPGNTNNAVYRATLGRAVKMQCAANGSEGLCWLGVTPVVAGVDNAGVKHSQLLPCFVNQADPDDGFSQNADAVRKDNAVVLFLNADVARNNYFHTFLRYDVTPNYGGKPAYLDDNIEYEENNVKNDGPIRQQRMTSFPDWADLAFPTDFTATATYYVASYCYNTNDPYYVYNQTDSYSTDL